MPGKVNPVVPEMIAQVAYQVIAQDLAITLAAQGGQLELNAFLPLIAANLLPAMESLGQAMLILADQCIQGIEAVPEQCLSHLHNSIAIITALTHRIGYDTASQLAKKALQEARPVRELLLETGLFSEQELDGLLQPSELTRPGIAGQRRS
jgi:aspartate ammonia-lyase